MSRVVVFGGRGFLGRQAVHALRADPRVETVLTPGRDECDLSVTDGDGLARRLRAWRPDIVVNCSGLLDGSVEDLLVANTMVTACTLDALRQVPARYVRIGSAGEYGPVASDRPVRETDPAEPVAAYGTSHLAATRLIDQAAAVGEVSGCTLRVFNPIGPGMRGNTVLRRAVERAWAAVRSGAPEIRMGSLAAYRDFVDSRDVGAAVVAAAFTCSRSTVFNVGSGQSVQVRAAVLEAVRNVGFDGEVVEAAAGGRSAGVDRICADVSRASEELGWRPTPALSDSLLQAARDVQPDWDLVPR